MLTHEQGLSTTKYLRRMVLMGTIPYSDYDRTFGKLDDTPQCCIDYYVRLRAYNLPPAFITDLIMGIDDTKKCKYVRCPKCRGISTPNYDIEKSYNHSSPASFIKYMRRIFA